MKWQKRNDQKKSFGDIKQEMSNFTSLGLHKQTHLRIRIEGFYNLYPMP